MVYILVINTQTLQIKFLHDIDHIRIQIRTIQLLIFTAKFLPLPGFEPQADMLPIELSWLGTKKGSPLELNNYQLPQKFLR